MQDVVVKTMHSILCQRQYHCEGEKMKTLKADLLSVRNLFENIKVQ